MWDKFIARRRWGRRLSLWYHPRYEAPSLARIAHSLGMISLRGKRVLAQLASLGWVKSGQLKNFPLVSLSDLELFHSRAYLERAGRRETLARIFGAPEYEIKVDEVLSAERWAVSGTLAAARAALAGPPLAFNLGGGFHHAEPEMGSGFCVFNDIGVAIAKLCQEGFAKNVVIVDLDFHQGNGNIVGFLDNPQVHNYSLHGAIWTDQEGPGHFNRNIEGKVADSDYLQVLEESLPAFLDEHRPGLVFYIAGHDVLERDPLGQFALSVAGAERRDRFVLDLLRKRDIPGVLTLGGGYSVQACQAALNLALAALEDPAPMTFDPDAEQSAKFHRVAHAIDPSDPQFRSEASFKLSEADFWPELELIRAPAGAPGSPSAYQIEREMENCGYFDKFRRQGLEDFRVTLDPEAKEKYRVRVEARPGGQGRAPLQTVAELVLGRDLLAKPAELRSSFL
ncbi:MAG TPA: histone deacetylase [bacterium]|nr:histone deacetylase [bacterium]